MRVVGRANQLAKRLLRYPLEIVQPLRLGQQVPGAVVNQTPIGKLVTPFNTEGFFPESVLAFDLEPYLPPHSLTPRQQTGKSRDNLEYVSESYIRRLELSNWLPVWRLRHRRALC